jgi:hypothetical protein
VSKVLKVIKGEALEGFTRQDNKTSYINIEYLYNKSKNEQDFIKKFCKVLEHEIIHRELMYLLPNDSKRFNYLGEEIVVRKLTNEKFTKQERDYYKRCCK